MLHGIYNSNNSIYSQIMFYSEVRWGSYELWILEFLLKYEIQKLTIKTYIKIYTYHENCNITVQISHIYYPLIHWILI